MISMSVASAYFSASFRRQLTYRFANWAGLFTNVFFLFFRAYALHACYADRSEIGGLSAEGILTYATLTQALIMAIPQWGRVGVAESVRSGQIAMDLCRPVSFLGMFLAQRLGISFYYLLLRTIPLLIIGACAGIFFPPATLDNLPFIVLSVVLGAIIANLLLFLIEVSSFWFGSEDGIRWLVAGVQGLFSGLILPIAFFPAWAKTLSAFLPFEYTLYLPLRFYVGEVTGSAAWATIGIQALWAVGLALLAQALFAAGTRKLVVHGG